MTLQIFVLQDLQHRDGHASAVTNFDLNSGRITRATLGARVAESITQDKNSVASCRLNGLAHSAATQTET